MILRNNFEICLRKISNHNFIHRKGYDQKGRVGAKWLNLKSEINFYRLILGCNAAKKNNQDKTKPIKLNNPQISIQHYFVYRKKYFENISYILYVYTKDFPKEKSLYIL